MLPEHEVDRLFADVAVVPRLHADDRPRTPDGRHGGRRADVFGFEVEPFRKHCLLNGLDDIGLTLQHADEIRAFEARRLHEQPWLA